MSHLILTPTSLFESLHRDQDLVPQGWHPGPKWRRRGPLGRRFSLKREEALKIDHLLPREDHKTNS